MTWDTMADPAEVGIALVSSASVVDALAGGRVFGVELPEAEVADQPRGAVVVAAVPGGGQSPGDADYVAVTVSRLDVRCYGLTPALAARLSLGVHEHLKAITHGLTVDGRFLVSHVRHVAGPVSYRATPGDVPVVVRTYDVMHADQTVS